MQIEYPLTNTQDVWAILATRMLGGWYVYTLGAAGYAAASFMRLTTILRRRRDRPPAPFGSA